MTSITYISSLPSYTVCFTFQTSADKDIPILISITVTIIPVLIIKMRLKGYVDGLLMHPLLLFKETDFSG